MRGWERDSVLVRRVWNVVRGVDMVGSQDDRLDIVKRCA